MPEPDALNSLLADLRSLRGRDRRAILAALSATERGRIAALSVRRAPVEPVREPDPRFAFSDWLRARLEEAPSSAGAQIAPAAREALHAAADILCGAAGAAAAPRGRSLLGALGSLLTGAGERR